MRLSETRRETKFTNMVEVSSISHYEICWSRNGSPVDRQRVFRDIWTQLFGNNPSTVSLAIKG